MGRYGVISNITGKLEAIASADPRENSEWLAVAAERNQSVIELPPGYNETLGWDSETRTFVVLPPKRVALSAFEFMSKLTFEEQVTIETAAASSAIVRVILRQLTTAQEIWLDHPLTINGIQALVSMGLITDKRASEILGV